jgi:hypothetical protein
MRFIVDHLIELSVWRFRFEYDVSAVAKKVHAQRHNHGDMVGLRQLPELL